MTRRGPEARRVLNRPAFFLVFFLSAALFFFLVYHANTELYADIRVLKQAGHTVVPNAHVLALLPDYRSAFSGSLFFTFTLGLVSAFTVSITVTAVLKKRDGMVFSEILNPLAVPAACALIVLSGLCLVADKGFFLKARNRLLLTNSAGIALNSFYYTHTLYAANALQSPMARQIKSYRTDPPAESKMPWLENALFRYGWLKSGASSNTALVISASENTVVLKKGDRPVVTARANRFYRRPATFLQRYAEKTDNRKVLRLLCRISLLAGIPAVMVSLLYAGVKRVLTGVFSRKRAAALSAIAAVLLCLGPVYLINSEPAAKETDRETISALLYSGDRAERVRALRALCRQGKSITSFPEAAAALMKGRIPERYWLARTLGHGRGEENLHYLKVLLADSQINVRCAAVRSLPEPAFAPEVPELLKNIMKNAKEWYVQYCAWEAWKQWRISSSG